MGPTCPTHPTCSRSSPIVADRRARRHLAASRVASAVDWEAELGIVIGRPVRRASAAEARDRDRGLHGRERRLDARLAVPDAAVAAGQDVGALDAGRAVAGDGRRGRRRRRPAGHVRGRRRGRAGRRTSDLLFDPVDDGRSTSPPIVHPRARRRHLHRDPAAAWATPATRPCTCGPGQVVRTAHRGARRAREPLRGRPELSPACRSHPRRPTLLGSGRPDDGGSRHPDQPGFAEPSWSGQAERLSGAGAPAETARWRWAPSRGRTAGPSFAPRAAAELGGEVAVLEHRARARPRARRRRRARRGSRRGRGTRACGRRRSRRSPRRWPSLEERVAGRVARGRERRDRRALIGVEA